MEVKKFIENYREALEKRLNSPLYFGIRMKISDRQRKLADAFSKESEK